MTKETLRLSAPRDSVSKGKREYLHRRSLEGLHLERSVVPRPGTAAQESIKTAYWNPNKDHFMITILKFSLYKENARICPRRTSSSFWEPMSATIVFEIAQRVLAGG